MPSGNFGNLTAGIFAKRIGLPVARFIASTNANDVVPEYLRTGEFHPAPAAATFPTPWMSAAPTIFRACSIYAATASNTCSAKSGATAPLTRKRSAAMKSLHERFNYIADPHTAVGVLGWEAYRREHTEPSQGLVLATAHPAKFADVVMRAIGIAPPLPDRLAAYLQRPKLSLPLSSKYDDFKQFLLSH